MTAHRRRLLASPRSGEFPTANVAVQLLESLDIVKERTGQKTNRIYSYERYVALLTS